MRKENHFFQIMSRMLAISILGLACIPCICCNGEDDVDAPTPNKKYAITFGNPESEQKAPILKSETGLESEQKSFVVYSYKHYPDDGDNLTLRPVMNKYKVFAEINGSNCTWNYATISGQTIHYWDFDADSYNFFAFAPYNSAHQEMTFENSSIKMPEISTTYTELSSDNELIEAEGSFSPLYSHPCSIAKDDFGKIVQLSFSHIFCQIHIGFTISTIIDSDSKTLLINQVSLVATEGLLCNKADINITYVEDDLGNLTTDMSFTPKTFVSGYTFPDKEVAFSNPSAIDTCKMINRCYHLFPSKFMGGQKKQMKLIAHINGEEHEVTLSQNITSWEPNKTYTYIFKIDNSLESKYTIRLYSFEIQEWKDGGAAETKDDGTTNPTEDW